MAICCETCCPPAVSKALRLEDVTGSAFGAQAHVRHWSWRLGKGEWSPQVIKASVLALFWELLGYLERTVEGEMLTTPSVYEHLKRTLSLAGL